MRTPFLPLLLTSMLVTGCATTKAPAPPPPLTIDARSLPMSDGDDGTAVSWDALMSRVADADVVFVGELHDDAAGHAFEQAFAEDFVARWPGSAVALEMLERDEQVIVDDFLEKIITAKQLERLTHSSDWGAPGAWSVWYQPILDSARAADAPVVAANAPRRYVRLARTDGHERLDALEPPRRGFVALPRQEPSDAQREQFRRAMTGDGGHELDEETLETFLRSQIVWDATMADSVAAARAAGAPKVVLFVGRFHCDYNGGTVRELQARAPDARILTVSLGATEREGDEGRRADVIVDTGR
jgi:uncharacterized iron-regulated protein